MKLIWTSAIVAAFMIGAPCSPAWAQALQTHGETTPVAEQSRVGLELDFLQSYRRGSPPGVLAADLVAQVAVTRHLFLDGDLPAALLGAPGDTAALLGNPMIGAHYAARFNRRISGFVGVREGLPLTGASKPALLDELATRAITSRAWNDPYRFYPRAVPLVAAAGVEIDLAPVFLQANLSPGLLAGTGGGATSYLDAAATAGLRTRAGLEAGLRAQATFAVAATDDDAQVALEPFLGYASPERVGLYARYGLLVPLDEPLGLGGLGFFTHRVSFGAKF